LAPSEQRAASIGIASGDTVHCEQQRPAYYDFVIELVWYFSNACLAGVFVDEKGGGALARFAVCLGRDRGLEVRRS
jgi:hypothetical protein